MHRVNKQSKRTTLALTCWRRGGFAFPRESHGDKSRLSKPVREKKNGNPKVTVFLVEEGGFEPPKRDATDLQSAPFGHSGTPPYEIVGAGGRTRTPDLLITNQLLYQLSYTSVSALSSSTTSPIIAGKRRVVNRKSKKISKSFWAGKRAPEGQERKHEREDFYQSAAGYAAPTGSGLVQAVPE